MLSMPKKLPCEINFHSQNTDYQNQDGKPPTWLNFAFHFWETDLHSTSNKVGAFGGQKSQAMHNHGRMSSFTVSRHKAYINFPRVAHATLWKCSINLDHYFFFLTVTERASPTFITHETVTIVIPYIYFYENSYENAGLPLMSATSCMQLYRPTFTLLMSHDGTENT